MSVKGNPFYCDVEFKYPTISLRLYNEIKENILKSMKEHNDNNIFICQFVMMRVINKYQNRTLVIISLQNTLLPYMLINPLFAFFLMCLFLNVNIKYVYAFMLCLNNDFINKYLPFNLSLVVKSVIITIFYY